jgi:hypothetical protein
MAFDTQRVNASLQFDSTSVERIREDWLLLMNLTVWGKLSQTKMGSLSRVRKRLLEVGENVAVLTGDRSWIPHPREQLKSALGSSIKVRDSLSALERTTKMIDGGDNFAAFKSHLLSLHKSILALVEQHESVWAQLLDSQLDDDESDV